MLYIKHYLRYIHNIKDYLTIKCNKKSLKILHLWNKFRIFAV